MNKIEWLENLQCYIRDFGSNESYFDLLHKKLREEISLEKKNYSNSNAPNESYLNNLLQTDEKQARHYIMMKRKQPVKGDRPGFLDFVNNFRMDIIQELARLKSIADSPPQD
jgi:hypothetical protein